MVIEKLRMNLDFSGGDTNTPPSVEWYNLLFRDTLASYNVGGETCTVVLTSPQVRPMDQIPLFLN